MIAIFVEDVSEASSLANRTIYIPEATLFPARFFLSQITLPP
jgi:hypothetical protein